MRAVKLRSLSWLQPADATRPGWEPEVLRINALYASRRHLLVAARVFIDFLVERFVEG